MAHIIKRKGHRQEYDERKVYASVFAACLNAHLHDRKAEQVAHRVSRAVSDWVKEQDQISSDQLFAKVGRLMEEENREAAFMYLTHRDIS